MRLWSVHPQLLDTKGLVALWREGLLARKVLLGETKGYKHHPQLQRFRAAENAAVGSTTVERVDTYLHVVCDEADRRGYKFDRTKLGQRTDLGCTDLECIEVNDEQLLFEFEHLREKLRRRIGVSIDPQSIRHHPMFVVVAGPKAEWEKA